MINATCKVNGCGMKFQYPIGDLIEPAIDYEFYEAHDDDDDDDMMIDEEQE